MTINQKILSKTLTKAIPELFLSIGGRNGSSSTSFDLADNFVTKRIPKEDSCWVIERRDWQANKVYDAWEPGITPDMNYYVWNPKNGIVYICLSNNPKNRKDLYGSYLTTEEPTHTSGSVQYSDGYSWLALYKIPDDKDGFITATKIPVPDFTPKYVYKTLSNQYQDDCGVNGATTFGTCCLYYKENEKDPFSGITYNAGDLVQQTYFSTCYECTELSNKLEKEKYFIAGATAAGITTDHSSGNPLCPEYISLLNTKEKIATELNFITPNSTSYIQYNILDEHETETTGIMSVSINLGDYKPNQRIISVANPTVVVVDPNGSGCFVKLQTVQVGFGRHEIVGIELVSAGTGYTIPSFYIEGLEESGFNDLIDVYPYPANIFTDPKLMIPSTEYVVNASISQKEIETVSLNKSFTKLALTTGIKDVSGYINKYADGDDTVWSTQTRIKAYKDSEINNGVNNLILPPVQMVEITGGEIENVSKGGYMAYVSAAQNREGRIQYGSVWVEGYEFESSDINDAFEDGDSLLINGEPHTIFSVTPPQLDKKTEYFSVRSADIQIPETGAIDNKTYIFTITVNNT